MDDVIISHALYAAHRSISLRRVTSLRRRVQADAPVASYWLRRVLDDGERQDYVVKGLLAAGGDVCSVPLPYWHCPPSMRSRVYVTVGRPSVRLSVCPVDCQQQQRPAVLLLSADVCSRYQSTAAGVAIWRRRSAAKAGSVMLRADGGDSTQTCSLINLLIENGINVTPYAHCKTCLCRWRLLHLLF